MESAANHTGRRNLELRKNSPGTQPPAGRPCRWPRKFAESGGDYRAVPPRHGASGSLTRLCRRPGTKTMAAVSRRRAFRRSPYEAGRSIALPEFRPLRSWSDDVPLSARANFHRRHVGATRQSGRTRQTAAVLPGRFQGDAGRHAHHAGPPGQSQTAPVASTVPARRHEKSHHDTPADDPFYVWDGTCEGNCAATLRDKSSYADLTGQAKIRWRTKQSGFRRLHIILKLAGGAWLVSDQWKRVDRLAGDRSCMQDLRWRHSISARWWKARGRTSGSQPRR